MQWDDEAPHGERLTGTERHQYASPKRKRAWGRWAVVGLITLVAAAVASGVLFTLVNAPATSAPGAGHSTPLSPRDAAWHDVGLSASEQIVFSHSDPQTAYSCGIVNKTIVLHVSHDGGMRWRPVPQAASIPSERCTLVIDETNPQQLAMMTLVTKPDPCLTTPCTPTPCAGDSCQPCIDYCPPPPQHTLTLYRSSDGGNTWKSSAPLPNAVHFTMEIAYAGSTLYAWTDTWPTLLASSVNNRPFQLIDLSAYFPDTKNVNAYNTYQVSAHLWPLQGQMYLPIPGGDYANQYIQTGDGGSSWTRGAFTMGGDPVVLRPGSGLDGRTLMGERIHMIGNLALSTDGGSTWQIAPAPYPDFTHYGQIACYVAADGSFIYFNGFDANFGLGVYQAKAGATAWTKLLNADQIQDVSVDLASYDANGRLVALWGRESQTQWVVYRLA